MNIRYFYFTIYLLILIITFNSLKYNIASDFYVKKYLGIFIPQGWGFFTRNPREEQFNFYKYNNNSFKKVDVATSSISNFLGLSRSGRFRSRELSILLEKANKDSLLWKKYQSIDSFIIKTTICKKNEILLIDTGVYRIERLEPLPWAWTSVHTAKDIEKKYTYIKFEYEN
jgi:antimicrobial peptide system SdpA family protein